MNPRLARRAYTGPGCDERHAPAVRVVDALRLYATWDDDPDVGVLDCGEDARAPFTSGGQEIEWVD